MDQKPTVIWNSLKLGCALKILLTTKIKLTQNKQMLVRFREGKNTGVLGEKNLSLFYTQSYYHIPAQIVPSPTYPLLHSQKKDPSVFTQFEVSAQPPSSMKHSS